MLFWLNCGLEMKESFYGKHIGILRTRPLFGLGGRGRSAFLAPAGKMELVKCIVHFFSTARACNLPDDPRTAYRLRHFIKSKTNRLSHSLLFTIIVLNSQSCFVR